MKIQITDKIVTCPRCQAEIGRVYLVQGVEVLKIGDLLIFDIVKGVCIHCSAPFFYSVPLKRFESMVDKLFSDNDDLRASV